MFCLRGDGESLFQEERGRLGSRGSLSLNCFTSPLLRCTVGSQGPPPPHSPQEGAETLGSPRPQPRQCKSADTQLCPRFVPAPSLKPSPRWNLPFPSTFDKLFISPELFIPPLQCTGELQTLLEAPGASGAAGGGSSAAPQTPAPTPRWLRVTENWEWGSQGGLRQLLPQPSPGASPCAKKIAQKQTVTWRSGSAGAEPCSGLPSDRCPAAEDAPNPCGPQELSGDDQPRFQSLLLSQNRGHGLLPPAPGAGFSLSVNSILFIRSAVIFLIG